MLNFGRDFNLLQYQYDRWLFKTVSGAVESGKALGTSPQRALETKSFSTAYWQWQHRMLKDAVRQFGYPSLFITVSPAEWKMPHPRWLEARSNRFSSDYRAVPYELTVAILHTLEQICRGYIAGANDTKWKKHVLSDTRSPANRNVRMYFYRFEFQKRGTPHVHMLVLLKSMKNLHPHRFSASVPLDNSLLADVVTTTQSSSKPHLSMPLREEPTAFEKDRIRFRYLK